MEENKITINEQSLSDEMSRFENPTLTEAEEREANERYKRWADGSMGSAGRVNDEMLARFMEEKLGNIQNIMNKGEEMRSWNGHIRRVEQKEPETDMVSRKEYNALKSELDEIKKLLLEKLK